MASSLTGNEAESPQTRWSVLNVADIMAPFRVLWRDSYHGMRGFLVPKVRCLLTHFCARSLAIMIVKSLSRVRPFVTPWTVANQAPPSMGFSRQEYRSGLPFPSPRDLPDPGIEPGSPAS